MKDYRIKTEIYPFLNKAIPQKIKFQEMINLCKKKQLLGRSGKPIYNKLDNLKDTRNRVHLQNTKNNTDTDYWKIGNEEQDLMKEVLYSFLTSSWFGLTSSEKKLFSFLK